MAQATLINPQTGERRAIETGSQEEKNLFGQGFVLEQQAPTQPTAVPPPITSFAPPTREEIRAPLQGQFSDLEERLRQAEELQGGFLERAPSERQDISQRVAAELPQAERIGTEQERLQEELRNLYTAPTEELFSTVEDPFARARLRDQRASAIQRELGNLGIIAEAEGLTRESIVDRENALFLAQMAQAELGVVSAQEALQALKDEFEVSFQDAFQTALLNFESQQQREAEQRQFEQQLQLGDIGFQQQLELGEIGFEQQKELERLSASLRPDTSPPGTQATWGSFEINPSGGLNFFDNEGDPVTADKFAKGNNMTLINVLSASNDPGDQDFIESYNAGINQIGGFDEQGNEITAERFEKELRQGFPHIFGELTIG